MCLVLMIDKRWQTSTGKVPIILFLILVLYPFGLFDTHQLIKHLQMIEKPSSYLYYLLMYINMPVTS